MLLRLQWPDIHPLCECMTKNRHTKGRTQNLKNHKSEGCRRPINRFQINVTAETAWFLLRWKIPSYRYLQYHETVSFLLYYGLHVRIYAWHFKNSRRSAIRWLFASVWRPTRPMRNWIELKVTESQVRKLRDFNRKFFSGLCSILRVRCRITPKLREHKKSF